MKKQVGRCLTACGLFALVAGCGTPNDGASVEAGGKPQSRRHLTRELPPVFARDATTQHVVFPLANDSEAEMHLGDVIHSCSCTNAELDRKVLRPGESGKLTLTINLK